MKHLAIAAVILWAAFHFGGMFFSSADRATEAAFSNLIEPPQRSIENPYRNGYFYLFGLTAASSLDPAKTGYEIWVDETEDARRSEFAERRATRADLVYTLTLEATASSWDADDPLAEFRKKDAPFHTATAQYRILLFRYHHWISMPFDDWGFGRRVTTLGTDILAVHRLYVAEGFSSSTMEGVERLHKDFHLWRTVLREAKTISTKVLAQIVIADDLQLLSRMLAKPTVDKTILTMGLQLTLPLSAPEYSLRWPIRHQLALAMKDRSAGVRHESDQARRRLYEDWLSRTGHLPPDAFDSIIHPPTRPAAGSFQWGQAAGAYAAYYEAIIKASENNVNYLPGMQEVVGTLHRGMFEGVLKSRPVEPGWEIFHGQLVETDTRLRLASLQIQLRHPSPQTAVPTRLAEVGSQYFDPFTGLPMLWSPTQQKLYSVGRDRLDDGGDPTFDISVPAVVGQTQAKPAAPVPMVTRQGRH
ncbi:MAG TPA: hypothetical protein VFO87_02410 [Nitrospira sp.]|nr:hypothetical protein [Nitrospira sp.]